MSLLTARQRQILQLMLDHRDEDEGELVYERGCGYLGDDPVAARTVMTLVRLCAISLAQDSRVGGFERYTINGTGEQLLRGETPEALRKMYRRLAR
jgi:hypothetical protein